MGIAVGHRRSRRSGLRPLAAADHVRVHISYLTRGSGIFAISRASGRRFLAGADPSERADGPRVRKACRELEARSEPASVDRVLAVLPSADRQTHPVRPGLQALGAGKAERGLDALKLLHSEPSKEIVQNAPPHPPLHAF